MSTTFVVNQNLSTEVCYKCGVLFAMPESWQKTFKDTHQDFYCPAGHAQHYIGKSDAEKLRDEIAEKERQLNAQRDLTRYERERKEAARAEAEHFRKSRDGMKGALHRISVRVKNGSCPCCNRNFQNLQAHMNTKHPGFKCEKVEP